MATLLLLSSLFGDPGWFFRPAATNRTAELRDMFKDLAEVADHNLPTDHRLVVTIDECRTKLFTLHRVLIFDDEYYQIDMHARAFMEKDWPRLKGILAVEHFDLEITLAYKRLVETYELWVEEFKK